VATDFIRFDEGANYIETTGQGQPGTVYFFLSTGSCNGAGGSRQHVHADTLGAALLGEITGTGYARQSQAAVTPSLGGMAYLQMTWATGAATDWPNNVRSVVAATTVNNTGKALFAWNLIAGGAARDLSQANTSELFTPSVTTTD
jgi:hypothetical protein